MAPPKRIIFFRDGVSEGEFHNVVKVELGAMRAAVEEIWKEKNIMGPETQGYLYHCWETASCHLLSPRREHPGQDW